MLMLMVFLTVLDEHDVDVEGLDPATVATMLELNIMHRTAGDQRKYIIIKIIKLLSLFIIIINIMRPTAVDLRRSLLQPRLSTDFTAITTNTNKKNTTNIFKSRAENKTYCHLILANI